MLHTWTQTHTHKTYLIVLGRDVSHSTSPTVSSLCFTTASTIFLSTHAHTATSPGSNLSLSNSALAVCGNVSLACKYKTMWCRTGGPKDSRGGYTDYNENKDLVENGQKTNKPSKCSANSSNCIFPWWMEADWEWEFALLINFCHTKSLYLMHYGLIALTTVLN